MRKFTFTLLLSAFAAVAQNPNQLQSLHIQIPQASQRAVLTQRIALTDVTVNYHRPVAGGRKVFGGIVPYGQVWRAGANDNTTIEFSTAVKIEGQPLAKGTYGLHMIPGENEWTIAFSSNFTSWGSFTYDEKEDALRVKVKPMAVENRDVLTYDFDDLKSDSAVLTLRWEKTAVPVHIAVDLTATTLESLRKQIRYTAQYTWEGLNDAASWCLENKVNYDEAVKWVTQSIAAEERFENLETKSQLLRVQGHAEEADKTMVRAIDKADATQLYVYARGLQREGKGQEGLAIYRTEVKKFPDHWISHVANARVLVADKNFDGAAKEIRAAIAAQVDNKPQVQALEGMLKRIENKEDINR
jgi:tetratricopeptide (TPR) repeat protein